VEVEKNVAKVRENLKISQSRQKSYADPKRRDISFEVGEHVYLRFHPSEVPKGSMLRESCLRSMLVRTRL
jgi:hypothetical protein